MAFAILSFGVAVPALAQSDSRAAGTSIRSASQSVEDAGSDTWAASKDTYYAAKIALRDTETTARVKAAFHHDSTTHPYDIDVTTTAGVVTLEGKIPSHDVAVRARQLALATEGVRRVRDRMVIISAANSPGY
jgi:osmotically-inducible protein OsmY